jgi:hypothetical protein
LNDEQIEGIHAKLDRADEHLQALTHEVRCFVKSNPNDYRIKLDLDACSYSVRVTLKRPPPIRAALICGDYAYCLRSALDHVAYAIVPPTKRRTVAFPICKCAKDFRDKVVVPGPKGKGALPSLNQTGTPFAYIEHVQPYNGRHGIEHNPLWLLDELCNADKHRTILVRACAHTPSPSARVTGEGVEFIGKGRFVYDQPLVDGAEVLSGHFRVIPGPEPKVHVHGDLPLTVAFGEDLLPLESLDALRNAAREVVENITRLDPPNA